ncbi:hypothetical protein OC834_005574 [Tilletia horrida]|nr:hypothetical protein OC834_005574 [Tilletia horrida]KAK0553538.1 hypothetical protein OC844_006285 [Tilletia horrida]
MSDDSTRTITFYESDADLTALSSNTFNLVVGKKVLSSSGRTTMNIVWQSLALASFMEVKWKTQYALSWTKSLPNAGAAVTLTSKWQPCNFGESYDINEIGLWVPSANPAGADPAFLNVGNVGYKYPGSPGINIVVGILNASNNKYEPIYVDPVSLPLQSSAKYQPQESAVFWYEANRISSSFIAQATAKKGEINTTSATTQGKFEWWATYLFSTGQWANSVTPPPVSYMALPASDVDDDEPEPVILIDFKAAKEIVKFAIPIVAFAARNQIAAAIKSSIGAPKHVSVTWVGQDGRELHVEYKDAGAPEPAPYVIALASSGSELEAALQSVKSLMPAGETWTIEDA